MASGGVVTMMDPVQIVPVDDGESLEDLYSREWTRAVRLAHLLTGSNEAAEDIVHEAFIRIGPRLGTGEIGRPEAYLTTTIVHLSRSWHRARRRRQRRDVAALVATGVNGAAGAADDAPGFVEHADLLALVDALPFRQRAVLVARYWLDLTEHEIAALLGCRAGTVKSLSARAIDTLRKELR